MKLYCNYTQKHSMKEGPTVSHSLDVTKWSHPTEPTLCGKVEGYKWKAAKCSSIYKWKNTFLMLYWKGYRYNQYVYLNLFIWYVIRMPISEDAEKCLFPMNGMVVAYMQASLVKLNVLSCFSKSCFKQFYFSCPDSFKRS